MLDKLKNKYEEIKGWAYQDEVNNDTLMLTSILNKNASKGILPQIPNIRSKNLEQAGKGSGLNLQLQRKQYNTTHISIAKTNRQKTEAINQFLHQNATRRNVQLMEGIDEVQVCPSLLKLKMVQSQSQQSSMKRLSELSRRQSYQIQLHKYKSDIQKPYIFKNDDQKMLMRRNDQFTKLSSNQLKKTHSKLFVKLNTLEMVHDLKIQFQQKEEQHYVNVKSQESFSEERGKIEQQSKTKHKQDAKLKLDMIQKMMKLSFVKENICSRTKKKSQEFSKMGAARQFNDDIIFSNNSLICNSAMRRNQSLHSDLQNYKHYNLFKFGKK